jgi:hypothetical protein
MLPKIDIPIYETHLISNGELVRFRPFLVKEQKLFLMANESDDPKETINTIKQVLRNCILDDLDVDNLATFDIEYLFLQLRARSVGEVVTLRFTCNNDITEENKCGNVVKIDVNVLDIKPTVNTEHSNKIQINDKIGIVLKYPTFGSVDVASLDTENLDQVLDIIVACIDYVYDEEQIYPAKDSSKKELTEFIENLKQTDLEKISAFFNSLPKMKKDVDFKCDKCGYHETLQLEGIQSFFV